MPSPDVEAQIEAVALAPCPFCGGRGEVVSGPPGSHYVTCVGCLTATDDGSIERIAAAWNTLAALPDTGRLAEIAAAEARGRAAERSDVVAWLRYSDTCPHCGTMTVAAWEIERGDHLSPAPPVSLMKDHATDRDTGE